MRFGRARGIVLRLVRSRRLAVGLGAVLAAPAVWIELGNPATVWWVDALSYLLGATGIALLWSGLTGRRADWEE